MLSVGSKKKTVFLPLYGIVDFETVMKPPLDGSGDTKTKSDEEKNTQPIFDQEAVTASIVFISSKNEVLEQEVFSESNDKLIDRFYEVLQSLWEKWQPKLIDVPVCPMLSNQEEKEFNEAKVCYLCSILNFLTG